MWSSTYFRAALRVLSLLACTILLSAICFGQTAEYPGLVYRTTVSEVRLTFFATDQRNQAIASLKPADFAVVDNERVVRNFRSFLHTDETALDVVALVDVSESVAPRLHVAIRDVLQLVSEEQSISDANISVLSFGGTQSAVVCSGDCRDASTPRRLLTVKSAGATPLYDALVFASDFIARRQTRGVRPVILLFSDGRDTISLHSLRDALAVVVTNGILIYSVDLNTGQNPSPGSTLLGGMSAATGGRYFRAQGDIAAVLKAALDDLRASYLVTYQLPSREVGFHSVHVLPTHDLSLKFHSRNGYNYDHVNR